MGSEKLVLEKKLTLNEPSLVIGFTGWMNSGDVSTGSIEHMINNYNAVQFAKIEPDGFYLYNFPGTMEFSSLFRPHVNIENGLITQYEEPENIFFASESSNMIFFIGKEPNTAWDDFADCIFSVCSDHDVRQIIFIGSVAGVTPHTREPRFWCSVSDSSIKKDLEKLNLHYSNYNGPSSIITYLTIKARKCGIKMISTVAEVPAYVQGYNPTCIDASVRMVSAMLGIHADIESLRQMSDEFEKRISEAVKTQPELYEKIDQLESDYDQKVFDNEMGDLKLWLQQKGVSLD